jgi:protocatechuate 4,5-dioxygenase beta chain
MARIIGGIGTSHVPTIAMAFDRGKQEDPDWKPLFEGYAPVAQWLAEKQPDVLFFCFNDHATTFFFDHYPTFALGVSDEYRIADEGVGIRKIPPLRGHAALSRHVARSLVDDEFDLTIFQDLPLDHGLHSPLTMMWPSQPDWPGRVVPLVVNVLQHPLPKPSRCYKLGKAIGKAIRSYPEDLKVAMVGTGGLSHQMIGERAGINERLARMTIEDFARLGGNEGAEVIMWLIMRGALNEDARKVHENYYLPMTTAMAVALFE